METRVLEVQIHLFGQRFKSIFPALNMYLGEEVCFYDFFCHQYRIR